MSDMLEKKGTAPTMGLVTTMHRLLEFMVKACCPAGIMFAWNEACVQPEADPGDGGDWCSFPNCPRRVARPEALAGGEEE